MLLVHIVPLKQWINHVQATSNFLRASSRRAKCCIYEETLRGNRLSFPLTQTCQRCWEAGCLSGKFWITGSDLLTGKVLVIAAEVIQCRALPMLYFCLIVFDASLFQSCILDLFLLLFLFLFCFFFTFILFQYLFFSSNFRPFLLNFRFLPFLFISSLPSFLFYFILV